MLDSFASQGFPSTLLALRATVYYISCSQYSFGCCIYPRNQQVSFLPVVLHVLAPCLIGYEVISAHPLIRVLAVKVCCD
jgi:hypothetical protein